MKAKESLLDFKAKQYRLEGARYEEKAELLKEILAFANSWRQSDAYILLGISESSLGQKEVLG